MQKFSLFGQKKNQTKIQHRMVMLEGLQMSGHTLFPLPGSAPSMHHIKL